jgi:hypothetical protein
MMEKREKSSQYAFSKMEPYIKENGSWMRIRKTVAEYKFGQMAPDTTDSGEMEWPTDMEDLSMPKEMFMRVNGLRIKPMVMACTPTSMDLDMRANGSKISNMALVLNNGQMVQNTRASMNRA